MYVELHRVIIATYKQSYTWVILNICHVENDTGCGLVLLSTRDLFHIQIHRRYKAAAREMWFVG